MPVYQHILENNTVLITEPAANVKTAAVGFWFSVGSRYESEGLRGISHFVEHMLFKGTKIRSAYQTACAFDRIGSYVNAYTDRETVCVHCTVPGEFLTYAVELLCDMISNSVFNESDIEKERLVIENEIITSLDDPEEAAIDAVFDTVWSDPQLSQTISGTVQDVKKITRQNLLDWYEKYFINGPLTVCIAGCVNQEEIIPLLSRFPVRSMPVNINNICFFPLRDNEESAASRWKTGISCITSSFQQEQICIMFPLPYPLDLREAVTLSLLNALAGDTMSSRLFQRLREDNGFCYNVYSFFNTFSNCGFWCAYTSTAKKNAYQVCSILIREIYALAETGISDEEFAGVKQHIRGEEIIASEDMDQKIKQLARHSYFSFPMTDTEQMLELIESITKDEIEKAARKLFCRENQAAVLYGPALLFGTKRKIIQALS